MRWNDQKKKAKREAALVRAEQWRRVFAWWPQSFYGPDSFTETRWLCWVEKRYIRRTYDGEGRGWGGHWEYRDPPKRTEQ